MTRFREVDLNPPDLTHSSQKNDGKSPFDQGYRAVDGRDMKRSHKRSAMTFWGDYLEARQKATRTRQRCRTEGANHRDRELRRDAAEEISPVLSRAASV